MQEIAAGGSFTMFSNIAAKFEGNVAVYKG